MKERHPALPAAREPFCTRSQMVAYVVETMELARAHRYLRPDGSLGASGRPDPKLVFKDGALYIPE